MDGGIGEAALMGAVIGGAGSAITGGNPLTGALLGGLTGGATGGGGIDSLLGGSTPATESAIINNAVVDTAGNTATNLAANNLVNNPNLVNPAVSQMASGVGSAAAATPGSSVFSNLMPSGNPFLSKDSLDTSSIKNAWNSLSGLGQTGVVGGGAMLAKELMKPPTLNAPALEKYSGPLSKFRYSPSTYQPDVVVPPSSPYRPVYAAEGGLMDGNQGIAGLSANPNFPMANQQNPRYAVPSQMPVGATDVRLAHLPPTSMASGGIADLGGYSDGGRLLKGPGDGMSDDIPASIGSKQPARLADGEFVVPADVVSHLGNGSTDAGAKQLYSMMDKVRKARTGRKSQGKEINPKKYVPA